MEDEEQWPRKITTQPHLDFLQVGQHGKLETRSPDCRPHSAAYDDQLLRSPGEDKQIPVKSLISDRMRAQSWLLLGVMGEKVQEAAD